MRILKNELPRSNPGQFLYAVVQFQNLHVTGQYIDILDGVAFPETVAHFLHLKNVGIYPFDHHRLVGQMHLGLGDGHIYVDVGVALIEGLDLIFNGIERRHTTPPPGAIRYGKRIEPVVQRDVRAGKRDRGCHPESAEKHSRGSFATSLL